MENRPIYRPDSSWRQAILDSMLAQNIDSRIIGSVLREATHRHASIVNGLTFQYDPIEQIVVNEDFQRWLKKVKLVREAVEAEIELFREMAFETPLSQLERLVLDAFEPFGNLTTYSLVARDVYGDHTMQHACRQRLSVALAKMEQKYGLIPMVTKRVQSGNRITGFGCFTELTPITLLVSSIIPRSLEEPAVSYAEIGNRMLPYLLMNAPSSIRTYSENTPRVYVTDRLEPNLPPGLEILREQHGSSVSLRWKVAA